MKKLLLLALTAVVMAGCGSENKEPTYPRYVKKSNGVRFVVIDGCEYIINKEKYAFAYTDGVYETYTHKGNCRFCAERRKQELKEFIKEVKNEKKNN